MIGYLPSGSCPSAVLAECGDLTLDAEGCVWRVIRPADEAERFRWRYLGDVDESGVTFEVTDAEWADLQFLRDSWRHGA